MLTRTRWWQILLCCVMSCGIGKCGTRQSKVIDVTVLGCVGYCGVRCCGVSNVVLDSSKCQCLVVLGSVVQDDGGIR